MRRILDDKIVIEVWYNIFKFYEIKNCELKEILNLNLNYNGKTGKIKTYIVDGLSIQKAIEKFILIK